MTNETCPFCQLANNHESAVLVRRERVIAFYDAFPSAPGHILVTPTAHVARVNDLDAATARELFDVALELLANFEETHAARAYTIGVNDGPAAGQTVPHVHVHLIPRNDGDTERARGGVRWAIPETADYWTDRDANTPLTLSANIAANTLRSLAATIPTVTNFTVRTTAGSAALVHFNYEDLEVTVETNYAVATLRVHNPATAHRTEISELLVTEIFGQLHELT